MPRRFATGRAAGGLGFITPSRRGGWRRPWPATRAAAATRPRAGRCRCWRTTWPPRASPSASGRYGAGCTRRAFAGSGRATSMSNAQLIWRRKRGDHPTSEGGLAPGDRLLCLDWTLLRLFPPLRAVWALKGTQALVPITGCNAKRVLFGAIDLRSARRVVLVRTRGGQADAQAFLRALRRRYRRAGWLWLLTDRASAHTAPQTQALADRLRIRFVWLPRQAPELSPMDP